MSDLFQRLVAAKLAGAKVETVNGGEYVFRSNEAAATLALRETVQSLKEFADAEDRRGHTIIGEIPSTTHFAAVHMLRRWADDLAKGIPPHAFRPPSPISEGGQR